jgi:23S rRNA (adenine2503-C2)-methyltransferase
VTPPPAVDLLDRVPASARDLLAAWVADRHLPAYRVNQMVRHLWQAPVGSWAEATELPLAIRTELGAAFPLKRLALEVEQQSVDGTHKYLWRLHDGEAIESVLIPSGSRRTLCISSQAGCALRCSFCATGQMGFRRNLSAFEIAAQVREIVLRHPADLPTNIVFMGMGEPLLNWPAVDTTLTILNAPEGFGIGARHITVSTVGILPGLEAFARRPEQFRLAVSLHAPTSAQRLGIMPIEKKYDLEAVLRAAAGFRKRVTFEYVMISGVNDRDADADRLAKLARSLGALVNILPLHPGGDAGPHAHGARSDSRLRGEASESRDRGDGAAESRAGYRRGVRAAPGEDGAAAAGGARADGVTGPRTPHPERREGPSPPIPSPRTPPRCS